MPPSRQKSNITDWPSYWFVQLEESLKVGDLQRASEAQRELSRLGYDVKTRLGVSAAVAAGEARP